MQFYCVYQEAALSAEMNAKEGLRIAMEKKERQFKKEIETLEFQVCFKIEPEVKPYPGSKLLCSVVISH